MLEDILLSMFAVRAFRRWRLANVVEILIEEDIA